MFNHTLQCVCATKITSHAAGVSEQRYAMHNCYTAGGDWCLFRVSLRVPQDITATAFIITAYPF